jgi:ribonuclease VapC
VIVEAVTEAQAETARKAYRDFGRGSGHPARLNFGDCFAYALAKAKREPLLFKGADFSHTDVTPSNLRLLGCADFADRHRRWPAGGNKRERVDDPND